MYKTARLSILLSSFLFVFAGALKAQQVSQTDEEKAYNKVVTQRAAKITAVLNISDSLKADRVTGIIANQYKALNQIHDQAKAEIKAVREKYSSDKAAAEEKVKVVENERRGRLYMQHAEYLGKLHAELSAAQVDKVKD